MAGARQFGGGSVTHGAVKVLLAVMGLGIAAYILGPPLYWHLAGGSGGGPSYYGFSAGCPSCSCDCSSQPLLAIPQELINMSLTDCSKHDPDVSKEMKKNSMDLLSEELKLREAKAAESQNRADLKLLEAKKFASQYQKEADKCNSGMGTCEEARERAENALLVQKSMSALWESRARQRGWKEIQ